MRTWGRTGTHGRAANSPEGMRRDTNGVLLLPGDLAMLNKVPPDPGRAHRLFVSDAFSRFRFSDFSPHGIGGNPEHLRYFALRLAGGEQFVQMLHLRR
jgi:hypothetical protein